MYVELYIFDIAIFILHRLAYSVAMIDKLITQLSNNKMHIYMMYDIVCTLQKHLKVGIE